MAITIRRSESRDLDKTLKLLSEVLELHAKIRPDIFISGTTKYTHEELQAIFDNDQTPVFVAMMQTAGCDINPTSYSKLEGQVRAANDKELYVIAKILNTTIDSLFENV